MFRISRLSDYGLLILCHFLKKPSLSFSASELSSILCLSKATVSKVLKKLCKAGLLSSLRGAQGGYVLSKKAQEITVWEVLEALEGPFSLSDCLNQNTPSDCLLEKGCPLKPHWQVLSLTLQNTLKGLTLETLSKPVSLGRENPS